MIRDLDHLVYCVPNLGEACDRFEESLGVRPVIGGRHPSKGTKNALLSLGHGAYFEILAVDESNTEVKPPRWMGIDLIDQPAVTRWSVKSTDLQTDKLTLDSYQYRLGAITRGTRATLTGSFLTWQLIEPLPHPQVDIVPFFLDWTASSEHPSRTIKAHCRITHFRLTHPDPNQVQPLFHALGIDLDIDKEEQEKISVVLEGPAGMLRLS